MDFVIAATAGIAFSFMSGGMLLILMRNAQKGTNSKNAYFLPCFSVFLTFPSVLLWICRLKQFENYAHYLFAWGIAFFVILALLFAMLYRLDRTYLKSLFPPDATPVYAPWYHIFVSAMVSSFSISTLLGWATYICFLLVR